MIIFKNVVKSWKLQKVLFRLFFAWNFTFWDKWASVRLDISSKLFCSFPNKVPFLFEFLPLVALERYSSNTLRVLPPSLTLVITAIFSIELFCSLMKTTSLGNFSTIVSNGKFEGVVVFPPFYHQKVFACIYGLLTLFSGKKHAKKVRVRCACFRALSK